MKRPTALFLFSFALLALVLSGVACDVVFQGMNAQATDEWKRTYKIAEGGQFQLINPIGTVEISPSADATTIEVVAERRARGASEDAAKQELKNIQMGEQATPTSVRIEVSRASSGGGVHMGGGGRDVSFKVKVPKNTAVKVDVRVGEVRVSGLSGSVRVDSSNGNITGEELSGPVQAGTRNGNVRVAVTVLAPDGIRLDTTNGNVDLQVPADSKANIYARWVNGEFEAKGLKPEGERERRRFEGKLNGGGPRIELNTTNGMVRISS